MCFDCLCFCLPSTFVDGFFGVYVMEKSNDPFHEGGSATISHRVKDTWSNSFEILESALLLAIQRLESEFPFISCKTEKASSSHVKCSLYMGIEPDGTPRWECTVEIQKSSPRTTQFLTEYLVKHKGSLWATIPFELLLSLWNRNIKKGRKLSSEILELSRASRKVVRDRMLSEMYLSSDWSAQVARLQRQNQISKDLPGKVFLRQKALWREVGFFYRSNEFLTAKQGIEYMRKKHPKFTMSEKTMDTIIKNGLAGRFD
jgi:hypothetical protein